MFDYLEVPVAHLRILDKTEAGEEQVGNEEASGLGKSKL